MAANRTTRLAAIFPWSPNTRVKALASGSSKAILKRMTSRMYGRP
jgi:hypothetical protein